MKTTFVRERCVSPRSRLALRNWSTISASLRLRAEADWPVAVSRERTSAGSAVANGACSVATAVSEHERGVIHQGQDRAKERDPVSEGCGAQHPSRTLLFLGNDDAVFGEQAQRPAARIQ